MTLTKAQAFILFMLIVVVILTLTSVGREASEKRYNRGYSDGYAAALRAIQPLPKQATPHCTSRMAAMWWTNTTNMKDAKRKLCS